MSWETRKNGKTYYYRKQRINGRVVSQYIGRGPLAQAIADADAETARADVQRRNDFDTEQQQLDQLEAALDQIHARTQLLITAVLLASGYHTHKGQWRRQRRTPPDPSAPSSLPTK